MFTIYDMNNYSRRRFETGVNVASVWSEINNDTNPVILVWDGDFHNARRRTIFPGYKMNRKEPPEDMRANQEFLRSMLTLTRHSTYCCKYWEADDVIAKICRTLYPEPIHVRSTDMDYMQLPKVINDKDPSKIPCPPHEVRLYKTLVGDDSDNIKGIVGFGPKMFQGINKPLTQNLFTAGLREAPPAAAFIDLGFKPAHAAWAIENWDLLQSYWDVIGFIDVPDDELVRGLVRGVPNTEAALAIFKEYMQ